MTHTYHSTSLDGATPVTSLSASRATKSSVVLSWASATTITNPVYEVQYSSDSSFPATNRTTVRTATIPVTLNNLTAGTTYYIRVRQVGYGAWASVGPSPTTLKPTAPTDIGKNFVHFNTLTKSCLLYTSPSPRD